MPQQTSTNWLHSIRDHPSIKQLIGQALGKGRVLAHGAVGSLPALLAGCIAGRTNRLVLHVVAHLDDADDALADLELLAAADQPVRTYRFGAMEVLPGESTLSLDLLAERLNVARKLREGRVTGFEEPTVIVAPVQALMQSIPTDEASRRLQLELREGMNFPPGGLLDWLDRAGYQRADAIEQPGDFATRGGIIDIFAPSATLNETDNSDGPIAVRLDFFGDEIESINLIDTDTMGSANRVNHVAVIGASVKQLQEEQNTTTLTEYLPEDSVVVLHEVMELAEQARGYYERLTDARGIYAPQTVFKALQQRPHIELNQYSLTSPAEERVDLPVRPLEPFAQDAKEAVVELAERAKQHRTITFCQKQAEADRLREMLAEESPGSKGEVELVPEVYLHRGFLWGVEADEGAHSPGAMLLVPHHEIFHRYHTRRRIRRVSTGGATDRTADAFIDLEEGDLVVHIDHGIAIFRGLKTLRRQGKNEEFLSLEYAGKAMLHVPVAQIEMVQKYIGGFQGRPALSQLGGKKWGKQKEAAAEAAKDLAKQMLQLQAARSAMPGIRYPADTAWQAEFEAEFPYDETEDQLAAIASIKKDMSDEQPMDRLICGDVGFGKTEVAIRGAFKAIEYGKQVAVLVPTTVLAEQHERTFRERMADYPFVVESLSRFKTGKEQEEILERVKQGRVDIVIGTHRLLSKDVKFADLGLVVIDEEQRFGVEHKNKLLEFRMTADVLTLSATPIPRTLHMAMLGLRDISSLSTAPHDRRAIVTEVMPYSKGRIKQAIIRELNRDGQVFFVHNRVHNIQSVADDLKVLVPEARIIIGHGQMPSRELEQVMLKFMRREADILVCTTIIESGIDIPTANTMFINQADHFGLAELHQLRGRVGRYKHRAYCYLLLPEDRPITEVAARRLTAIEQFAMLGAGFKIAMRDLEIRGAGNLLGKEQSGHIAAVGYQMYCMLLEREAKVMRQERIVEPMKTHVELGLAGRIEASYIKSNKHRMDAYKRLARAETLEQYDSVVADLKDAYGEPGETTQLFLDLAEIRVAASHYLVRLVKLEQPDIIFQCDRPRDLEPLFKEAPGRTTLIDNDKLFWRPPENYLTPASTLLAVMRKLLVRPLREASNTET